MPASSSPHPSRNLCLEATYTRLPQPFYTRLSPTPVRSPRVVLLNQELMDEVGLPLGRWKPAEGAELLSGNRLPPGIDSFAQAYAGHQFGHFTILGDGRAHVLGEWVTPSGRRFDLQLKGSGQTPYSRGGDGRAALGPMLREYLISEAMHALGIPTTRSLAVVGTGEEVLRETPLPGAILARMASSHIRVGTFQFAALFPTPDHVGALLEYSLQRHMPELLQAGNRALAFLEAVVERQAELVAHWLRVGFIHGVMNSDNCAISGETLDYGPCAFLDAYHPDQVFSSIDRAGRYAFMNQPRIAQWNLARLAETLLPLLDPSPDGAIEIATRAIEGFGPLFATRWREMMRSKLGLSGEESEDPRLFEDLLAWMAARQADYTNTFLALRRREALPAEHESDPSWQAWKARWEQRRARNPEPPESTDRKMKAANPVILPRNHKVEEALQAATEHGDLEPFLALHRALARPYQDLPEMAPFQVPPRPEERVQRTFCGT